MWRVTLSSRRDGEILRREYFDSKTAAELRGFQFGILPAPIRDQWTVVIELV